jgi:hypothetical protein
MTFVCSGPDAAAREAGRAQLNASAKMHSPCLKQLMEAILNNCLK